MEIGGLPLHVLLVHGVVVLLPLLALTALVYGFYARSRAVLAWPLLVGAFVVMPMTLLAKEMGEKLMAAMPANPQIAAHGELGDATFAASALLWLAILTLLAATWQTKSRPSWLAWTSKLQTRGWALGATIATVLFALAALVLTVMAGHSGAASVWTGWRHM